MSSLRLPLLSLSLGLMVSLSGMTGCQTPPKPQPQVTVPTADRIAALRDAFARSKPGALVGEVTYVLPDQPYALVADIPVKEVKTGETISFVDADGNPFSHGVIADSKEDFLHVKFDSDAKRRVQKGDIAVWLKQ